MPRPDHKLIAGLLDRHGGALALYASQWTSEPDDCVQEALVELASQRTTPRSPVAWVYCVVKRRAMNAARAGRRRRNREQEAFRRRLLDRQGPVDPSSNAALVDAVSQLDPIHREAIVLRLWGGLTLAEISEATGVATSTAARRYEAGISALREQWSSSSTHSENA